MDVTFTDDIPKIEREGFSRTSKYTPLLDKVEEKAGKAAVLTVETQGQASSRASSIKTAAENHEAVREGRGLFKVATRSTEEDDEFHVYVKFVSKDDDEYEELVDSAGVAVPEEDAPAESKSKKKGKKKSKAA